MAPEIRCTTYLNQTCTSKHLHNHTGCNDRRDTQLHDGSTVGGQNDTHPVERIRGLGRLNTIDGDLATDKENKQSNGSPKKLLAKGDLLSTHTKRHLMGEPMTHNIGIMHCWGVNRYSVDSDKRYHSETSFFI